MKLYQFYLVHLDELPLVCMGEEVEGQPYGVSGSHVGHGGANIYQGLVHSRHQGHHWNTGSPAMEKVESSTTFTKQGSINKSCKGQTRSEVSEANSLHIRDSNFLGCIILGQWNTSGKHGRGPLRGQ